MRLINKGDKSVELFLYDVIGDWGDTSETTARQFAKDLKAVGAVNEISVRINSPGGSVWDATAIYNTLKNHPARVVVNIDGIALSAASWIAMAGDEINIAENGLMMIHAAMGLALGNAAAMRETADLLDKSSGIIAATYAARTGKPVEHFVEAMNAETWYDAHEALAEGLATNIVESKRVAACAVDPKRFTNPERLQTYLAEQSARAANQVARAKIATAVRNRQIAIDAGLARA